MTSKGPAERDILSFAQVKHFLDDVPDLKALTVGTRCPYNPVEAGNPKYLGIKDA